MDFEAEVRGTPALLVMDAQEGYDDAGERNNFYAERLIANLLAYWRERSWPVLYLTRTVEAPDSAFRPDHPGHDLKPDVAPEGDEPVIDRTASSAFVGTDLEDRLAGPDETTLVLCGFEGNGSIASTARTAAERGYETYVVGDASVSFTTTGPDGIEYIATEVHWIEMASLHGRYATVVYADDITSSG